MTRHLAGLDLTGWRDSVTRNWRPHDDDGDQDGEATLMNAGVTSCAVMMGQDEGSLRPVGGPLAALAPHGRGAGWGEIGNPERRRAVSDALRQLLKGPDDAAQATITAAARALCFGADQAVVTIPDLPEVNDAAQQRVLDALRDGRIRRPFLLWRSVALCLSALSGEQPPPPGAVVAVVEHDGAGLRVQILRVRAAASRGGAAAPERRKSGSPTLWRGSLSHRRDAAVAALLVGNPSLDVTTARLAEAPTLMALGEAPPPEIVRLANGAWIRLKPPCAPVATDIALPPEIVAQLAGCSHVILDTPMRGAPQQAMRRALELASPAPVSLAVPGAAARGAFEAGERLSQGAPVYFDFLPQVSVVVQRDRRAVFASLVPEGATVAANETYRTADPPVFLVSKGVEKLEFYLRKEGEARVRRATVALPARPTADERVTVELEQRPAQGLARIEVRAKTWPPLARAPIRLNWATMAEDPRIEADLLEALSQRAPSAPERLVLPCFAAEWHGTRGLDAALRQRTASGEPAFEAICKALPRTIDSDGDAPPGVDTRLLDEAIAAAAQELLDSAARRRPPPDNAALRLVTWCFSRCPEEIQSELVKAAADASHPWAAPVAASVVIWQGLGRVTDDPDRVRQVLDMLFSRPVEQWNRDLCACAAFLMARRDETFDVMTETETDFMCRTVAGLLAEDQRGSFGMAFNYHLQMAGGLLRRRRVDPFALLADTDKSAETLRRTLQEVAVALNPTGRPHVAWAKQRLINRVNEIIGALSGNGAVTLRELFEQ